MAVLVAIYVILGYWAAGKTVYRNTVLVFDRQKYIFNKLFWAVLGGWILIPIAILMTILGSKKKDN